MLPRVAVRAGEFGLTGDGGNLVIEEWCHQIGQRHSARNSEGLCQIRGLILLQEKCEHCNQQTEEETKLNALRDIQHHDDKTEDVIASYKGHSNEYEAVVHPRS